MRKRFLVEGTPHRLVSEVVRLYLNQPGEGTFEVMADPQWHGKPLVELYVSFGTPQEYLVMTGFAQSVTPLQPGLCRIECLELSAVMQLPLIINKYHSTPREIIGLIEAKTSLRFMLPTGATYLDEKRVHFQSHGTCRDALDAIATKWELPNVVWYQLPDGRMYWGHWSRGPFTANPLPIDPKLVQAHDEKKRALVLPYIPALRPGMLVESDFLYRIDSLEFKEDTVTVYYMKMGTGKGMPGKNNPLNEEV